MHYFYKIIHNNFMIYLISFGVFIGVFTLSIAVILWVGIDVRIAFNPDNGFAVVDCFILKNLFLFKVKIIVHNGEFYMKIGGGVFRRMSYYKNEQVSKKTKTKKFPKLTLHNMQTKVCVGADDNPLLAATVISVVGVIINNLQIIAHNKLRIKGYNRLLKPEFAQDSLKLAVDANMKLSFISLILYIFNGRKVDKGETI